MDLKTQRSTWIDRLQPHHPNWKRLVIVVGVLALSVQWVRVAAEPRGDFKLHWELGRRMSAGEFIYAANADSSGDQRGHDYPYPAFWGLAHVPLTIMSPRVAQVVVFPTIFVSLIGLLFVLDRLTRKWLPLTRDQRFWATTCAVFLTSRFIVRDAPECGVNLALVCLSWIGVYLWTRRREWFAGLSLGLAMALKCTPALFLAYFVWKRQWKMVATTTVAAAAFTLAPVALMGPTDYSRTVQFWFAHAWDGVGQTDPSIGVLGEEPFQNLSLRPSMARFLMHLPEGHRSRLDHPLFLDFLDLNPRMAGLLIKGALVCLLASVAWAFRGPVTRRDDLSILWECATVSVLILLFSPITWGQHCVGVLPVLYLVTRTVWAKTGLTRWAYGPLGAYVFFVLVLNRELVGKQFSWLLDSYHAHTWCFLGLTFVAVMCHRQCGRVSSSRISRPTLQQPGGQDVVKSAA